MEKASEEPLVRSSSISDDYLQFLGQPHHMEKRFPVDRRKLEKLIKGGCGLGMWVWHKEWKHDYGCGVSQAKGIYRHNQECCSSLAMVAPYQSENGFMYPPGLDP